MAHLQIGTTVRWVRDARKQYGVIASGPFGGSHEGRHYHVRVYNNCFTLGTILAKEKRLLSPLSPHELSKLNKDIKLLTIGRLQYSQHYFRKTKYKKPAWHKGFRNYQQICKQYGIPLYPKRTVPRLSAEW